jgi:hypothetical protein
MQGSGTRLRPLAYRLPLPATSEGGENPLRDWLEQHHPRLLGVIDWPSYRLFGDCWAEDCPVAARLNVLHTPRQLWRCENTPMAIALTDQGEALAVVMEAEKLTAETAG